MTVDDKIKDEELQCEIKREGTKISVLSSGETDKYEYLTIIETYHPDQSRAIEKAVFTYYTLRKFLEKIIKTIEDKRKKQAKALED